MAVSQRTHTEYWLECDECGARSTSVLYEEDAQADAKEEGFTITTRWNGLEHITTILCPDCGWEWPNGMEEECP